MIYEDDDAYRNGLSHFVATTQGLNLVGAFPDCRNIEKHVEYLRPDLVLMDLEMPFVNGFEGILMLKNHFPEVKVLILTYFDDNETIFRAMSLGPDGYLLKMVSNLEKLSEAITETMEGRAGMSPYIAKRMIEFFSKVERVPSPTRKETNLSDKETEALRLLVKGFSYKMVASEMRVSINTIKSHLKKIYQKLQVHSAPEAVAKAILEKLV